MILYIYIYIYIYEDSVIQSILEHTYQFTLRQEYLIIYI